MPTHNRLTILSGLTLSILALACSTQEKEGVDPIKFIEVGDWQTQRGPWPNRSPVWLKSVSTDNKILREKAFDAFDFNNDGRPDMVEKFSDSGEYLGTAYDFNLDGKIDVIYNDAQDKVKKPKK